MTRLTRMSTPFLGLGFLNTTMSPGFKSLPVSRVIFCASMQSPTSIVDSIDPVGTTNGSITNARKRKTAATTAPMNVMNFRIFFRIEVIFPGIEQITIV